MLLKKSKKKSSLSATGLEPATSGLGDRRPLHWSTQTAPVLVSKDIHFIHAMDSYVLYIERIGTFCTFVRVRH